MLLVVLYHILKSISLSVIILTDISNGHVHYKRGMSVINRNRQWGTEGKEGQGGQTPLPPYPLPLGKGQGV